MKKNKKAFTLAEVLITLTIIGVIAAITVPALIQRTNKQEYVTALQKAYSTLSQAAQQIIAENGTLECTEYTGNTGGLICDSESIYKMYKKHLNILKDCGSSSGCFAPWNGTGGKYLDGETAAERKYDTDEGFKVKLSDGTSVYFSGFSTNTAWWVRDVYGLENIYGRLVVDINGEKGPNTAGRDLFTFGLKETRLVPAGVDAGSAEAVCSMTGNSRARQGEGCALKVLREGAMNY